MLSVADIVSEQIKSSPLLEEALARNIINYSTLARELKPAIEKRLLKEIKKGSIVMALRRAAVKIRRTKKIVQEIYRLGDLTIRSNLTEFTFINSATIAGAQSELFSTIGSKKGVFINFSQGVQETTLIVSQSIEKDLMTIFQKEKLLSKITQLSSITIRLPEKEYLETHGVFHAIFRLLSWEEINIIEIVSTYVELTLVFAKEDVDKAFSIISNYQK